MDFCFVCWLVSLLCQSGPHKFNLSNHSCREKLEVMNMSDPSLENDAKIWKFIYGFGDTLVLKCCVDLEIADTIHKHGQPMTLSQLASQLSNDHQQTIDTDRLYRLMRYLVHMKLFTEKISTTLGEGSKYELLPPAKFLLRGGQKSMVGLIHIIDQDFFAPWHHVKDGLSGHSTVPFERALGMNYFDYLSKNPKKNQLFNEAMACDSRLLTSELTNCKNVFQGIKTLVDIGGGTGTMVRAIANAFPHIKCIVYDLPHVNADAPVDPNIQRIDGDIFKSVPKADAILMKWILHDWNDNECIQILKHCKESIPQDGGKVIIIDIVVNANSDHPYTKVRLLSDLDMMINTGGKERTEEEWKKLLEAAGFTGYKLTEISAVQSIIEAYPF